MPLRVSGVPPALGDDDDEGLVEAGPRELGEHAVDAVGVGVVEEEDGCIWSVRGWPRASATNCGPRAEPPMPMSSTCLKLGAGWRRDRAGVDVGGEILDARRVSRDFLRIISGRGRSCGVAQPVVADHAAFVGVGDGTGFDCLHVGEGLGDARLKLSDVTRRNVHQGEVEGESVLGVTDEALIVGLQDMVVRFCWCKEEEIREKAD